MMNFTDLRGFLGETMERLDARTRHVMPEPALRWIDGHILGNGDMGTVAWGTPEQFCFGFSKHNVWDLTHPEPHGNRWSMPYPEMKRRILAGERDLVSKVSTTYAHGWQEFQLSCGTLGLNFCGGYPWTSMKQELSMVNGDCRVEVGMSDCGFMWGGDYHPIVMTSYVHAERNLLVVRFQSRMQVQVTWSYQLKWPQHLPAPVFEVEGGTGIVRQDLPNSDGWALALGAKGKKFEAMATPVGLVGTLHFGKDDGEAWLVVSMSSRRDPGVTDPAAVAAAQVRGALVENLAGLHAPHHRWWHEFWSRSSVAYADDQITRLWHMGLYALASSTRPHLSPPNLQGIWNQQVLPPWHTDFHNNVNVQECHWAACRSNHPELQEALIRCLTRDWIEEFRRLAREEFQAEGLAIPLCHDLLGRSLGGWVFDVEICMAAWYAEHLWWQWRHEGDTDKLRDEYLPFLRECCQFYNSVLHEDEKGKFHFLLSHGPEQYGHDHSGKFTIILGKNPAIDVAFVSELFTNFLEACRVLGVNDAFTERCRQILTNLPPLPTKDGFIIDHELNYLEGGDQPGHFPYSHRHPSRLSAIYPCEQIHLSSKPEALDQGRRSYEEFLSYGDKDFSGWSYSYQTAIAARLGLADHAHRNLRMLLDHFVLKGLLTAHNRKENFEDPIFQIEALMGMPAGLNEMLLQAVEGTIRLFPAVPEGRAAAFRRLRVPGGHLVSAFHDGRFPRGCEIATPRGGTIRLWNPEGTAPATLTEVRSGRKLTLSGALLEWESSPGETWHWETA